MYVAVTSIRDAPKERFRICLRCLARWKVEPDASVTHRIFSGLGFPIQRERRIRADERAETDPYILADDDCLPEPEPFIGRALGIMERHPQFAILSLWPANCTINRWTPGGYAPFEDEEVMEHVSVGGIRMCRKGAMTAWPPMDGPGYDQIHCDALRAAGFRVGYFKNVRMEHLGEGASTVWNHVTT